MKTRKLLALMIAMVLFCSQLSVLQVDAAFIDDAHWIESTSSTITAKLNNNEAFVAMFYRTTCPNSKTRKLALESWMDDYDLDVYGVDVDKDSIPNWVYRSLGVSSVTLPVICIVKNKTEYACFSAAHSMKQIQKYLHESLGIYDDAEVDFSKLNGMIISQYSTRASTAKALYLDTVVTNAGVQAQAKAITADLTSDMDKLKAIYDWITANVFYDYGMLENPLTRRVSAAETLDLKRSVCEGFANLTAAMCHAVDIPCRVVTGFAAGVGTDATIEEVWDKYQSWAETGDLDTFRQQMSQYINHAWNEAYVDGRWVILDTTWGCNNDATYVASEGYYFLIRGTPTDAYFDLSVDALSESHLTWTDYSMDLQLIPKSGDVMIVSGALDSSTLEEVKNGLLAVYQANGKMLFCSQVTVSDDVFRQEIQWNSRAAYIKLFLLNENMSPVTEPYNGAA